MTATQEKLAADMAKLHQDMDTLQVKLTQNQPKWDKVITSKETYEKLKGL